MSEDLVKSKTIDYEELVIDCEKVPSGLFKAVVKLRLKSGAVVGRWEGDECRRIKLAERSACCAAHESLENSNWILDSLIAESHIDEEMRGKECHEMPTIEI